MNYYGEVGELGILGVFFINPTFRGVLLGQFLAPALSFHTCTFLNFN